jgi:glycosyltransferase involved in cell wall biosynthesis
MKILLITGSIPPEICGVGDYTEKLASSLAKRGIHVRILTGGKSVKNHNDKNEIVQTGKKWRINDILHIMNSIKKFSPDIIHIQYPSIGFGYSIIPQLISVIYTSSSIPVVTTIHEFKIAHLLRKISILIFLYTSDKIILTTDEERSYLIKFTDRYCNLARKSNVIPIGSNLPNLNAQDGYDNNLVVFWGMFHKAKGIDMLLKGFQEAIVQNPNLHLLLIGGIHPRHAEFINDLKCQMKTLKLEKSTTFMFDKPLETVAQQIQRSCVVVLPFNDGVTFRRGTFIAAAQLGIPVITSKGKDTPDELMSNHNIIFANNPAEITESILTLTSNSVKRGHLSRNLKKTISKFNWDSIAEEHIKIYDRITKI